MTSTEPEQALSTDVLVIVCGPAGTWAAIKAAQAGADVVLADKGYTGASGATASVGTGIWYVDDVPEVREAAMASREALGGFLADRDWMARVLDETHARMDELARIQRYPFPVDTQGRQLRGDLQGPEYMRRQRTRVRRLGVRILDHTPALELLTDADGVVSGARALDRTTGETVRIEAGAVVLAAGGCAFQSKTLGCDVNTGDGALLAVEAGARLSGMEFSNAYAIAPKGTSLTKTAYYSWATFYRADGSVLEGAGSTRGRSVIARALVTEPVYARFDRATPVERRAMRKGQPNTFLVFDRLGIDPFTDLFEITLLAEGTVRGTGGVRIADQDCSTDVPGLYAAGDTATRELICGGFTGGGSHNAAWAASSGSWAGRGAAAFAARRDRPGHGLRAAGCGEDGMPAPHRCRERRPPRGRHRRTTRGAAVRPKLPAPRGPSGAGAAFAGTWSAVREGLGASGEELFRAREAAAMVAHGRWMYHAALQRTESRGMHKRADRPAPDPAQHHRLLTGGLDEIWSRPESVQEQLVASGGRAA
ncbi:FAD-binding protein [Streptomyces antimycoticus]|uniref:FAD-binding protein n=1 Tax=Streptomyces antimycoticus TaxID=68175 RepID=UPI0033D37890